MMFITARQPQMNFPQAVFALSLPTVKKHLELNEPPFIVMSGVSQASLRKTDGCIQVYTELHYSAIMFVGNNLIFMGFVYI